MSKENKEIEKLYDLWINAKDEDEKYLIGWLYWNTSLFNPTLEGLSAYKAYRNLPKERRMEYALYSSNLFDIFFLLNDEQLDFIERTLPPYPYIGEMIWKDRNLREEEINLLKERIPKNPIKARKFIKEKERILKKYGLTSEEYASILEKQKEDDWKDFQKIIILFYGTTAVETYLATSNPWSVFFYLLTFPIPYQLLKYLSFKLPNKRIRNYIDKISLLYFAARSPLGLAISTVEFGFLTSFISKAIEKYWYSENFPNFLRKSIYATQTFLSNLKTKEFDEREIREQLYNIRVDSLSIPQTSINRFKEEVDNGIIELEDPRKVLLHPWAISWFRRKVVAIPEGREIKIVDKEFVRKLAEREGTFLDKMEIEIKKYPTKYLGFDLWNGRIVFTRDVIGVLPCHILDALAYKEGYIAILGKKGDELFEKKLLEEVRKIYQTKEE